MLKWLNSYNSKSTLNNDVIKEIINKENHLKEHSNNLVIQSDKEFKISTKPRANKFVSEQLPNNKDKNNSVDVSGDVKELIECNAFNIQCKVMRKPQVPVMNENSMLKETDEKIDQIYQQSNEDVSVKDLQTLLIMMAITSKANEPDEIVLSNNEIEYNDTKEADINGTLTLLSQPLKNTTIDNILNVTPIRMTFNDKREKLIRKYVNKWKDYVCKRQDFIAHQRQETLNNFLEKLAKKKLDINKSVDPHTKAKLVARDYSTYQHRYKMQKHIIALQKAKLEEQNRLIDELKYNKILEASRDSVDAMRDEIRKTYFEIDRQLKPKIKCLTNELKIPEIDASSLVLHCLKVPQFLQRMEKRAREREEKHAMIRERRRQMEEERIRLKQQAELAKAEMDKEEKMKRIKELREKRKREKIENIRKKQFAERMRALTVMADLHYEKYLMAKYGIRPLKKLLELKRDNMEKAKAHYKFQLTKNVFLHLMWYTEDMWFERTFKAVEFYRKNILRKVFEGFKKNHHEYVLKKQVADDYYDLYVTQLAFRNFRKAIDLLKRENESKMHKAILYHNWNIIFKTFTCWRTLPALNALKREQEARKARWREKVLQVVPDYTPPDD
ncbi:hypothetical protein K1T71_008653 [Dendrolimus kikuchii]|uniref:Uncharacterized protein n=1 Tax=Dendrolimus kikuchii TaxID=765133 RepID=A0ACC1CVK3_9NEOP|nr:hypothetical protein K1T71_008653 [Dendrolimus kikuchii]